MQSEITLEKAKELVRDAVKRFPNRTNPRQKQGVGGVCLYTGPRNTHCIAGQVLADLHLPLPDIGGYGNSSAFGDEILGANHPFTEDAINYIRAAQYVFDGGPIAHHQKNEKRRWSAALNLLEKHADEAYDRSA